MADVVYMDKSTTRATFGGEHRIVLHRGFINLPAEHVGVEPADLLEIARGKLDVDDWMAAHRLSPSLLLRTGHAKRQSLFSVENMGFIASRRQPEGT